MSVKLDKLEGHSRRNKLRFVGIEGRISESWYEREQRVQDFIFNSLGLTVLTNVKIKKVHGVGSRLSDCHMYGITCTYNLLYNIII